MNDTMKRYLETMGFKARPEHEEISEETMNRLRKMPEFRSMIEALQKGQIDIDVVPERKLEPLESIERFVVTETDNPTPEPVMPEISHVIPEPKPIRSVTHVPLTDIPVKVGGVGGSPPMVKSHKQRVGKTTIQIDDDIAEIMKRKKGDKSFNDFLRELLE